MFYNETLKLFERIAEIKKRAYDNIILPYSFESDTIIFKMKHHARHYEFILGIKEPKIESNVPNISSSIAVPSGVNIAHGHPMTIAATSSNTIIERYIKVCTTTAMQNIISVEWSELPSNFIYFTNSNGTTSEKESMGNKIMSAMILHEKTLINGEIYSLEDNPDAFIKDIEGSNKFSILEVLNLEKDYKHAIR
ncbi:hypothetical protein FOI42_RS02295 [Escherichia coli]|nr:hypothetical protein [Escherichia coli]